MPAIARNIAGVLIGLILGGIVNMGIVVLGPSVVPPPPGVDVTSPEAIAASMHLFESRHFLMPFLAHAVGTLVGALVAYLVAASHRIAMAMVVGAAFFAGGVSASVMIPAPTWFIVTDLVLAYFPMAWLGQMLAGRLAENR